MVSPFMHYCECPVYLLYKDQSRHLMGKGHLRERNLKLGRLTNTFRDAVSTAGNKRYRRRSLGEKFCKFGRSKAFPFFIEKGIRGLQLYYPFALLLCHPVNILSLFFLDLDNADIRKGLKQP